MGVRVTKNKIHSFIHLMTENVTGPQTRVNRQHISYSCTQCLIHAISIGLSCCFCFIFEKTKMSFLCDTSCYLKANLEPRFF